MSRSYDPVRLGAPDGLVREVDGVTGRRYRATGGGMYEMHPRDAAAFKAEGAFVPTIGGPTIQGGYTCPSCSFHAVVRTCSRCGTRCETGAERRARLEPPVATRPRDWTETAREILFGGVSVVGPAKHVDPQSMAERGHASRVRYGA